MSPQFKSMNELNDYSDKLFLRLKFRVLKKLN